MVMSAPPWRRTPTTPDPVRGMEELMREETLMQRTHRLLKEEQRRGHSLPEMYADLRGNGSRITFYWLRKFASGEFEDPSVNRVEELYNYLTGKSLFESEAA